MHSAPVEKVLICGGTHGNELTGVYLIKKWLKQKEALDYSFSLDFLLANPAAISSNKRYIDKDLNRCFTKNNLAKPSNDIHELQLAQTINQTFGPKGSAQVDMIIDLHTSTANMKTNLVITKPDIFHLRLAAFVKSKMNDVIVTCESELMDDHHFLSSIADKNILIEVGPVVQGVLDYNAIEKTQSAVNHILDFIEQFNNDPKMVEVDLTENKLDVLSYIDKIYFPTDENGEICACIHPGLIGKDYSLIKAGMPIFKTFDGQDIKYQGDPVNIAFINEAAYYDQKIAMCTCYSVRFDLQTGKKIV